MKAFVFLSEDQGEPVCNELATLFSPTDISLFDDRKQLEKALAAVEDSVFLVDCTSLDLKIDTVHVMTQALEKFASSEAELLVLLGHQGEELPFLKIFKPYIWKEIPLISIKSRNILPLPVSSNDYKGFDRQQHVTEAQQYRDRIGERLFSSESVQTELKHLVKDDVQRVNMILSIPAGKKLLDVGCSDGSVTLEMAKKWQCQEVVGIDIAESTINEAKKRAIDLKLSDRVHFIQTFIEDLDSPDGYFNTVSACETLEHIGMGQMDTVLRNLVRMLRDDGNMIVTVPNRYPSSKYVSEGRDRWRWVTHYNFFTKYSLGLLLKQYFDDIEFHPLHADERVEESIYLIAHCRSKRR
ncbi:class I SAM-dependent methyltransferase [Chloroflexota bacterium]